MNRQTHGSTPTSGAVAGAVTRDLGCLRGRRPDRPVGIQWQLKNWLTSRWRDAPKILGGRALVGLIPGVMLAEACLAGRTFRRPVDLAPERLQRLLQLLRENVDVGELARAFGGDVTDYGTLSTRVVTDAGVAFLVDSLQGLVEPELLRYHGFGTGGTAEGAAQTALVTEETTQYATDSTRPTGTQTEGASANIFRTVGTYSPDSGGTRAITEHGIFSQAAVAGGTMLDRSLFSAVNLVAGSDSLQVTYELTLSSGG